jgi:hypothetical protein
MREWLRLDAGDCLAVIFAPLVVLLVALPATYLNRRLRYSKAAGTTLRRIWPSSFKHWKTLSVHPAPDCPGGTRDERVVDAVNLLVRS